MAVITISRQYGSGGREVAARLCETLGYRYFDKALMAEVASEVGLSAQEIVDFSEDEHRVAGLLDRLLGRPQMITRTRVWREGAAGARVMEAVDLDARQSIALVRSVIHAAYKQGDVVVVGRGGQAVLRGLPGVLHVRIQAPFEERVRRVSERDGLTREAAEDVVLDRDRAAQDYLRMFYSVDVDDPALYHLVINTGLWSLNSVTRVVVDALKYLRPA